MKEGQSEKYGLTAKQLVEHLEEQGIGIVGQDLFYSFLPDSPDACISILILVAGRKIGLTTEGRNLPVPDSGCDLRRGPSLS